MKYLVCQANSEQMASGSHWALVSAHSPEDAVWTVIGGGECVADADRWIVVALTEPKITDNEHTTIVKAGVRLETEA